MYFAQYGIDKVIEDNYAPYFSLRPIGIECGAADGVRDSVLLHFEQEHNFFVVNVEAHPYLFSQLVENRPKASNYFAALSDHSGTLMFTSATKKNEIPGGSVGYKKNFDQYLISLGYALTPLEVTCKTYDSVTLEAGVSYMDLFVLDVEGHELDVLRGMNTCLPKIICAEYTLCGLEELKCSLLPKGYRFDFVSYNNALFSMEVPEREWIGKTDLWRS